MRHRIWTILLCLLISAPDAPVFSKTQQPEAAAGNHGPSPGHLDWATTAFSFSTGYRTDTLNWHIAGNSAGANPNIRSELTWSDLTIYQLKIANQTVIKDSVYIRGYVDYGRVISGRNQDSDYDGDGRTQEFSRSVNGVDGNSVWDGSVGIGPRFSFFNHTLVVCPLLGYGISEQDLNIVDGYQAFTAPPAGTPTGPIIGLDSRYQTTWRGPWIGMDLLFTIPLAKGFLRSIGVVFSSEYHWVDYEAEANWNLRTDYQHPVSFTHDAEGTGMSVGAMIRFETERKWGFHIGMNVWEMTTDPGLDRIFYADGTTDDTRLNAVRWHTFTVEAGLIYPF